MTQEKLIQEILDDDAPLKYTSLARLSDMASEEAEQFAELWRRISDLRRVDIVQRMVDTAEDNVELDFTSVFKIALRDELDDVRERAVLGLWEREERHLITAMANMLAHDPSPRVRSAAALGLGRFAVLAEDGKLLPKDQARVKDSLLAVIRDDGEDAEVRRRALEAVGALSDGDVLALIAWAYRHADERFRQSAVFAMGRNASPEWLQTILRELESEDAAMRYEAVLACGELGEEATVPHLAPLLQDEDDQVSLATISTLGNIGGSMARRVLTNYLAAAEGDESVIEAITDALDMLDAHEHPLIFKNRR